MHDALRFFFALKGVSTRFEQQSEYIANRLRNTGWGSFIAKVLRVIGPDFNIFQYLARMKLLCLHLRSLALGPNGAHGLFLK
jgi:hypothetical protein